MQRKHFYLLLFTLSISSYVWIYYHLNADGTPTESWCLTKNVTGYPCPACGSTRSVVSIVHGDFTAALLVNPLGYVAVILLIGISIWLIMDFVFKKESLFHFYKHIENRKYNKFVIILGIVLILANWIWNIKKGL